MKIAILGFGTVGSGAYEVCKSAKDLEVVRILDLKKPAGVEHLVTSDINDIVNDDSIDVVAEAMGGVNPAFEFVTACMNAGKHVVTPNKNLVSAKYDELMACAEKNNVQFRFTPAAGGGIPWLYNLQRTARCDTIREVRGIVNGTCNFILDNMHTNRADFDEVLKEAQSLGYAEADPTADIAGHDTQRKCVISANLAFGTNITEMDVPTFGIDTISISDIAYATEHGYTCRLLMNAAIVDDKIVAYVEPAFLTQDRLEANVKANFNLITLDAENVGTLSFYGQGAGKMPTGASLVEDIIDIKDGTDFLKEITYPETLGTVDNSIEKHQYYMRFNASELATAPIKGKASGCDGYTYFITEPLSVAEAHRIANEFKASDKPFFMAGIK